MLPFSRQSSGGTPGCFAPVFLVPGVAYLHPPTIKLNVIQAAPDLVGGTAGHFKEREFTFEFNPADLV
jgi:hypothetical protein